MNQDWKDSVLTGSGCLRLDIPAGHAADHIPVWYHRPAHLKPDARVVIVLHGISRAAEASRDNWKQAAEQHGFFVAVPEFTRAHFSDASYAYGNFWEPAAPFDRISWDQTHGKILDLLFDQIRVHFEKCEVFTLYGHSAGAAFAHRYLTLAPKDRVEQAVLANAGWYTPLDYTNALPFGIKNAGLPTSHVVALLGKPITILLGELDTVGPDADWWPQELFEQGPQRVARGLNFFEMGRRTARDLKVQFGWNREIVLKVGHENKKMIAPAVRVILGQ